MPVQVIPIQKEQVTKTIREVTDFIDTATQYLRIVSQVNNQKKIQKKAREARNKKVEEVPIEDEKTFVPSTKFERAVHKMVSRLNKKLKGEGGYYEWLEDEMIKHASVDADKNILWEDEKKSEPKMTTTEAAALTKAKRDYLKTNKLTFENYILPAEDIPNDFTEDIIEAFIEFVLPKGYELSEDKEEAQATEPATPEQTPSA